MATLTADTPRVFEVGGDNALNEIPIIADDIVYEGAAVGESSSAGTGRPLVAGDTFLGFSTRQCDNAGGLASAKRIEVYGKGVARLSVTGVSSTAQVGDSVYASDDNTFNLTASANSAIGKIIRWITGAVCLVAFEAAYQRSL